MGDLASKQSFPRGVLFAAAGLVGLAVLLAGAARVTGVGTTPNPTAPLAERVALRFEDRADGAVLVYRSGEGQPRVLAPGSHGFVRSVLRGLARERRARGVGAEPPFHLSRWVDGRLSLDDPSTGRTVELGAFGPSNAGAFAVLLAARDGERPLPAGSRER